MQGGRRRKAASGFTYSPSAGGFMSPEGEGEEERRGDAIHLSVLLELSGINSNAHKGTSNSEIYSSFASVRGIFNSLDLGKAQAIHYLFVTC